MTTTINDHITRTYTPSNLVRVFIEDATKALCATNGCLPSSGVVCGHRNIATQVVYATIDHCIDVVDASGDSSAAELLRGEL